MLVVVVVVAGGVVDADVVVVGAAVIETVLLGLTLDVVGALVVLVDRLAVVVVVFRVLLDFVVVTGLV